MIHLNSHKRCKDCRTYHTLYKVAKAKGHESQINSTIFLDVLFTAKCPGNATIQ